MRSGFTLVELILYLGLFAMFIVVVAGLFASTLDIQLESAANSTVQQDGRYIISRVLYDTRRASSVAEPAVVGVSGNALQLVIGGVSYTYVVAGNRLEVVNDVGTYGLNSFDTTISDWVVTRVGNGGTGRDTVKISFVVTSQNIPKSGNMDSKTFTTTVGLR